MKIDKELRKQWKSEYDAAWHHAVRQYFILCAKDAIELAPLPEFKDAIAALEFYDEDPTELHFNLLKKTYRTLAKGRKTWTRGYGYSAAGEIYYGLLSILWTVVHRKNSISTGHTQPFTEAFFCAANALNLHMTDDDKFMWVEHAAQDQAYKRHQEFWKQSFGKFHEDFGSTGYNEFFERKLKATKEAKVA